MEDKPCTLTLPDGTHYDLTSLSSAKADYVATVGETSYKLNVCRSVVSELWTKKDPEKVAAFVTRPDGDFSLGEVNSTLYASPTGEPLLAYQDGSLCPSRPLDQATTVIRFICSPSDFHAGTPSLVASVPPGENECHFYFEWRSHVACPTNKKSELETGHYIAFVSIIAIAFITWLLGHTLYNRFYLKRRGREIFPFPDLSNLRPPSLPTFSKSTRPSGPRWGSWRRGQDGYSGIRADEHDEHEGLAGRFSLEDDEEERHGEEDARALGEDADAWRDIPGRAGGRPGGEQQSKVGTHQGLINI